MSDPRRQSDESAVEYARRLIREIDEADRRPCLRFVRTLYVGELSRFWEAARLLLSMEGLSPDGNVPDVLDVERSLFLRLQGWTTFRGAGGRREEFERWCREQRESERLQGPRPLTAEEKAGRPGLLDLSAHFGAEMGGPPDVAAVVQTVEGWLDHLRDRRIRRGQHPAAHLEQVLGTLAPFDRLRRAEQLATRALRGLDRRGDGDFEDYLTRGDDAEWDRRRRGIARRMVSRLSGYDGGPYYVTPEQVRRLAS